MERSLEAAVSAGEWGYAVVKALFVGINLAYVLGGAVGAVLYVRRLALTPVLHLLLVPLYLSVLHMLLFATGRYQIPAIPALIVFFAYLIVCRRSGAGRERQAGARLPITERAHAGSNT